MDFYCKVNNVLKFVMKTVFLPTFVFVQPFTGKVIARLLLYAHRFNKKYLFWIKCRIPDTWYDSSTVNFTIEKSCQLNCWKQNPLTRLFNSETHYWRIMPCTKNTALEFLFSTKTTNYPQNVWKFCDLCTFCLILSMMFHIILGLYLICTTEHYRGHLLI